MARRFLNLLTALSLLLCAACILLWVDSYRRLQDVSLSRETWPQHNVWRGRGVGARLVNGSWIAWWGGSDFHLDAPEGIVVGWDVRAAEDFRFLHPGGWRWNHWSHYAPSPPDDTLMLGGRYGFAYRRDLTS